VRVAVPPLRIAVIVEPLLAWKLTALPGTLLNVPPVDVTFNVVPLRSEFTCSPSGLRRRSVFRQLAPERLRERVAAHAPIHFELRSRVLGETGACINEREK
jgi:hypothetical protein